MYALRNAPWIAALATTLALAASCSHGGGGGAVAPADPVALTLSPPQKTLALGTSKTFKALAWYEDGSSVDVSSEVVWTVQDSAIASLASSGAPFGRVTAQSIGVTQVVATHAVGLSAGATVTVTPAVLVTLAVEPTQPSIALGTSVQLTSVGSFSDGSTQDLTDAVLWDSSAPSVADVSSAPGSEGACSAVGLGTSLLRATDPSSGISATTVLTVTAAVLVAIEVSPAAASIALGTTLPFTATGTFSDGTTQDLTTQVTWQSDDALVAVLSNAVGSQGLASALALGLVQVSALHTYSGTSGSTSLEVTPAELVSLQVGPDPAEIALGTAQAFTAMGTFTDGSTQDLSGVVLWTSSSPAVAAIDNGGPGAGLATSAAVGSTTITAEDVASGIADSALLDVTPAVLVSLEVAPANSAIALGTTLAFSATGLFTDSTVQDLTDAVTWSSSDLGVATLGNSPGSEGLATSLAVGTVTVTAEHGGGSVTGSTTLEVTAAVLVGLELSPKDPAIALGMIQPFTATGTYSDATTQDLTSSVTWSSTDSGVAAISNASGGEGTATALAVGSTTVAAVHSPSGLSDDTTLSVTTAVLVGIAIAPEDTAIALGTGQALTATGIFSDSSTQDLTAAVSWISSDASVATISNAPGSEGQADGLALGVTTITALHAPSGISGSTTLSVTPAVLVALEVTPANVLLGVGDIRLYTAIGTFSDASTQDLTAAVTWASFSPGVATISNAAGSEGLVTGVAGGIAAITALHVQSGVLGATAVQVVSDITLRAAASAGAASGVLSLALPTPAGTVEGDFLLAALAVRPNTVVVTPPTGWTLIRRQNNSAQSLLTFRRLAVAGEPATHAFGLSASAGSAGGIAAFLRVHETSPVVVENAQNTGSSLSHNAPSLAPATLGTMLVTAHAFASTSTWTSPLGMLEAFDQGSDATPNASGISLVTSYALHTGSGATGVRTAVAAGFADVGNGAAIALRRAP